MVTSYHVLYKQIGDIDEMQFLQGDPHLFNQATNRFGIFYAYSFEPFLQRDRLDTSESGGRIKTIPVLKELEMYNYRRPIT